MGQHLCGAGDSGADIRRISAGLTGNVIVTVYRTEYQVGIEMEKKRVQN